uniref:Putative tRNA nucleotidyl transferase n=1 Tax=Magnetococcus massalia (strain MO-1) TaxID=451514 RepID=A0A1S7LDF8_MAGMO|nr:putative tRNA nucleotidyl transferase [Candidatus Magnetococcus massalia]
MLQPWSADQHHGLECLPGVAVYLVGGALRDSLLGLKPSDRDWLVVGATAEQMSAQGFQPVGRDFPVFLHPQNHEAYALARTEQKQGHGYRGFHVQSAPHVTLEEDLARRDLSINAIAMDRTGKLIDPYGGQRDLKKGRLRHVSAAFAEDPLRVVRLARFHAHLYPLEFYIMPETEALCQQVIASGELMHLTPERVWQEVQRALAGERPDQFLLTLHRLGAYEHLFGYLPAPLPAWPQLSQAAQGQQGADIHGAVWLIEAWQGVDAEAVQQGVSQMAQSLGRSRRWQQEMLWLISQLPRLVQGAPFDQQFIVEVMETLEGEVGKQRAQRLEQLLGLYSIPDEGVNPWPGIKKAWDLWLSVKAAEVLADGYKGAEVGVELRKRRMLQLQHHWGSLWGDGIVG